MRWRFTCIPANINVCRMALTFGSASFVLSFTHFSIVISFQLFIMIFCPLEIYCLIHIFIVSSLSPRPLYLSPCTHCRNCLASKAYIDSSWLFLVSCFVFLLVHFSPWILSSAQKLPKHTVPTTRNNKKKTSLFSRYYINRVLLKCHDLRDLLSHCYLPGAPTDWRVLECCSTVIHCMQCV